ncbi:Hint domain-containing protein [Ascidiaceihabitans sp.]|nr:Hint domain-containing protein [Ascidiaceihabitans sp.]
MFGKAQTVVEAGDLIDGEFITDRGTLDLQLVHLTFDRQHVIYADGLEISVPLAKAMAAIAASASLLDNNV